MTLQEMKERKRELGYTNEIIAEKSGVPLGTVQKIFAGQTKAPRRKTIDALETLLSPGQSSKRKGYYFAGHSPGFMNGVLQETSPAYAIDPKQGRCTIDDYYALPDDRRVELIDGMFYDMASPSQIHQQILGDLFLQLAPCAAAHPGCRIFFAPLDVCLDNDKWTMVQPDLLITCSEKDTDVRRINGAPDFVAEILSPASRYHDMFRKLNKYRFAGVREYWIIDPDHLKITVYHFEKDLLPETYDFQDEVEVRISEGKCRVDFRTIYENIQRYLM